MVIVYAWRGLFTHRAPNRLHAEGFPLEGIEPTIEKAKAPS